VGAPSPAWAISRTAARRIAVRFLGLFIRAMARPCQEMSVQRFRPGSHGNDVLTGLLSSTRNVCNAGLFRNSRCALMK
jgi:hypothetical protein